MKEEKIAQMKAQAQVNDLIRNSEKIVKGELENSVSVALKAPVARCNQECLQIDIFYPEILDLAIRYVCGRLGLILEEFKFNLSASSNSGSFRILV